MEKIRHSLVVTKQETELFRLDLLTIANFMFSKKTLSLLVDLFHYRYRLEIKKKKIIAVNAEKNNKYKVQAQ
jgi:hypothetical protein